MPESCNPDSRAALHGNVVPLGRTTHILRATVALLVATLAVAMYAGLAALILPIVVLRSVFDDRGRRQGRLGVRAPATESPLRGRSVPFPATIWQRPQGSPTAQ
jgi:hypothetical protein